MNKNLTLAILFFMTLAMGSVMAQEKSYKKVRVGLGLEGALPVGNFATAYTAGGGLTLRVAVALNEKLAITGTTGVLAFAPKDISGYDLKAEVNIPVKAGLKYMLSGKVYGLGEVGSTTAKVYYPSSSGSVISASSSSFTYSIGAGTHLGAFDTSLRYEGYTGSGFIGLRIGFNF